MFLGPRAQSARFSNLLHHQRIGWTPSMTVLKERVAELRPIYLPPDPCQRTEYRPGELAQWDLWQPDVLIPLGHDQAEKLWVIVGVAGYSRVIAAWMIPPRQTHDVLGGHLRCLQQLGGVPRRGVYGQEPAIGRWHGPKAVDRGVPTLPRHPRDGRGAVQAGRPRSQGSGGAGE